MNRGYIHNPTEKYQSLREIRKAAGRSTGELADMLGVSKVTVEQWESGVRYPSWPVGLILLDVIDALQMEVIEKSGKAASNFN